MNVCDLKRRFAMVSDSTAKLPLASKLILSYSRELESWLMDTGKELIAVHVSQNVARYSTTGINNTASKQE